MGQTTVVIDGCLREAVVFGNNATMRMAIDNGNLLLVALTVITLVFFSRQSSFDMRSASLFAACFCMLMIAFSGIALKDTCAGNYLVALSVGIVGLTAVVGAVAAVLSLFRK